MAVLFHPLRFENFSYQPMNLTENCAVHNRQCVRAVWPSGMIMDVVKLDSAGSILMPGIHSSITLQLSRIICLLTHSPDSFAALRLSGSCIKVCRSS